MEAGNNDETRDAQIKPVNSKELRHVFYFVDAPRERKSTRSVAAASVPHWPYRFARGGNQLLRQKCRERESGFGYSASVERRAECVAGRGWAGRGASRCTSPHAKCSITRDLWADAPAQTSSSTGHVLVHKSGERILPSFDRERTRATASFTNVPQYSS